MTAEIMNEFKDDSLGEKNTPYLDAKSEWDNRIGGNVIRAKNWRAMAFCLAAIIVMLVFLLAYVGTRAKYIPYIVEVSKEKVISIARPHEASYSPSDASLKYYLTTFVEKTRSLSLDKEINKKFLIEAYGLLSGRVATKLDEFFKSSNSDRATRFKEKQTIAVQINSFTQVTKNTYQMQWFEEVFDVFGHMLESNKMVGFITFAISAPESEKSILMNPLGIWITDFTWSTAKESL